MVVLNNGALVCHFFFSPSPLAMVLRTTTTEPAAGGCGVDKDIRQMHMRRFSKLGLVKSNSKAFRRVERQLLSRIASAGEGRSTFELTFIYEKSMERWLDTLQRRERVAQVSRMQRMRSLRHQYGRYVAAGLDASSGLDASVKRELSEIALVLHRKRAGRHSKVLTDEHLDKVEKWLVVFRTHCHRSRAAVVPC